MTRYEYRIIDKDGEEVALFSDGVETYETEAEATELLTFADRAHWRAPHSVQRRTVGAWADIQEAGR